jgi:hypothetical protein
MFNLCIKKRKTVGRGVSTKKMSRRESNREDCSQWKKRLLLLRSGEETNRGLILNFIRGDSSLPHLVGHAGAVIPELVEKLIETQPEYVCVRQRNL